MHRPNREIPVCLCVCVWCSRLKATAKVRTAVHRLHLDVFLEGFVFRIRIFHSRELELLQVKL
jgi:hypothetical protein